MSRTWGYRQTWQDRRTLAFPMPKLTYRHTAVQYSSTLLSKGGVDVVATAMVSNEQQMNRPYFLCTGTKFQFQFPIWNGLEWYIFWKWYSIEESNTAVGVDVGVGVGVGLRREEQRRKPLKHHRERQMFMFRSNNNSSMMCVTTTC